MFINIITPCTRPENLKAISKSINIPKENYRWIVVFDSLWLPNDKLIPDNCECYAVTNYLSRFGNAQRNYAIDLVKEGYLYFNDDDTVVHKKLWENVKDLNDDFIVFQQTKNNKIRNDAKRVQVYEVDSHNFLVNMKTVGKTRWKLNDPDTDGLDIADGLFAVEVFENAETIRRIFKPLAEYNTLRNDNFKNKK
jgi:hypothetical protein